MDVSIYTRQNCSNVSYTVYHRFYCLHVVRLWPGSVYEMGGDLSQTVIDALNAKYHFDEPIIKQYGYFLQNIFLHWDWGTSAKMRPNVPVFEILRDRIPITLQINLISLFAALPVGMAAGIIAAIKKIPLSIIWFL